jgi:hypothetical protein
MAELSEQVSLVQQAEIEATSTCEVSTGQYNIAHYFAVGMRGSRSKTSLEDCLKLSRISISTTIYMPKDDPMQKSKDGRHSNDEPKIPPRT